MNKRSIVSAASVLGIAMVLGFLVSLFTDRETGALAELRQIQGTGVERDFAAAYGAWSQAGVGALFAAGDGMRTLTNTTAALALADASELRVSPNTTLRFLAQDERAPGSLGLDVQSGEAVIRVGPSDMPLRTHIGRATLLAGSQIALTRDGAELGFAIKVGKLMFQDEQGKIRSLGEGERVLLAIGMAELAKTENSRERSSLSLEVTMGGASLRRRGSDELEPLATGRHQVSDGSELRLAAGGRAVLRRGDDQAELRGEGLFVLGGTGGAAMFEARRGEATLHSRERDLAVRVPGGVITVRSSDGQSQLHVGEQEGSLEVTRGKASATLHGVTEELTAGERHSWGAELARSALPEGEQMAAPDYFNLSVPVGESLVLHAPLLPISAAFAFATRCPGDGELEILGSGQKTRGRARINALLSARSRGYTLRCVNDKGVPGRVLARGSLRVLLDAGTRKLPPVAPTAEADADGRTYTVYYSNQAPSVRIRWPNAPTASSYTLSIDGREQSVAQAAHTFASGSLRDGLHQVSFRAGTRGSRTTFIDVRFDNNAPTASVEAPADRSFASGQQVLVEGVSLPAWKVALPGGTLNSEAGGRFSGTFVPGPEHPDVVVRLSHPRLGVHYYVRRASSSP